jgi:hypothetical protein
LPGIRKLAAWNSDYLDQLLREQVEVKFGFEALAGPG